MQTRISSSLAHTCFICATTFHMYIVRIYNVSTLGYALLLLHDTLVYINSTAHHLGNQTSEKSTPSCKPCPHHYQDSLLPSAPSSSARRTHTHGNQAFTLQLSIIMVIPCFRNHSTLPIRVANLHFRFPFPRGIQSSRSYLMTL